MQVAQMLAEGYGRLPSLVRQAVDGLSADQLTWAPAGAVNTIGWLVWHLTRVQDHHLSEVQGADQLWPDFADQFGLPPALDNTGYGHGPEQVAQIRPESPKVLIDYYDAVAARTSELLASVTPAGLDRIVDRRWDPPVTLGVRLISVLEDDLQHVGQAAYLRGMLPPAA